MFLNGPCSSIFHSNGTSTGGIRRVIASKLGQSAHILMVTLGMVGPIALLTFIWEPMSFRFLTVELACIRYYVNTFIHESYLHLLSLELWLLLLLLLLPLLLLLLLFGKPTHLRCLVFLTCHAPSDVGLGGRVHLDLVVLLPSSPALGRNVPVLSPLGAVQMAGPEICPM